MELFERIRLIAAQVAGSQKDLALGIGIPQNTFQGYLKLSRQDNLWPLLPLILGFLPQVSREWLYFEEGEMLLPEGHGPRGVAKPRRTVSRSPGRRNEESQRIRELEEMVRLQQELLEAKAPETLERRYAQAMDELNDLRTKVIDLQAELLSMHRERGRDGENDGVISTSVPGGNYVVPLLPRDNDK